jgi:hypothetical protein
MHVLCACVRAYSVCVSRVCARIVCVCLVCVRVLCALIVCVRVLCARIVCLSRPHVCPRVREGVCVCEGVRVCVRECGCEGY